MKRSPIEVPIKPSQEILCAQAWAAITINPAQTVAEAARSVDLAPHVFTRWISQHHRGEIFVLRVKKGLPMRGGNGQSAPAAG